MEDQILKRGLLISTSNFNSPKHHCNFSEMVFFISPAHACDEFALVQGLVGDQQWLGGPEVLLEARCHSVDHLTQRHSDHQALKFRKNHRCAAAPWLEATRPVARWVGTIA